MVIWVWIIHPTPLCTLKKRILVNCEREYFFGIKLETFKTFVVPIFCVRVSPLRDRGYCEWDVGGGLCHGHISHVVHPKTLILDRLKHSKKWLKNLENTFSDALAILNFFFAGSSRQIFSVGDKLTCQVTNCLSSDWLTCQVDLCPSLAGLL